MIRVQPLRRKRIPQRRRGGGPVARGSNHSISWSGISSPATLARWCRAREGRPRTLDKGRNTIETNQFGTDEFLAWCNGWARPLMGLSLGTGTPEKGGSF
jgi:hypothetical protein